MSIQFEDLQTPALIIDLDIVRANIARTLEFVDGKIDRWRPHIKTSKVPAVMELLLEAGVKHFKCATTKEADCLLSSRPEGIDLLICMSHRGANLRRVAELSKQHGNHRISLLTEDAEHAATVRETAPGVELYIDLNPGYDRTGSPLSQRERILATVDACGDALRGLHFYDGHLHHGSRSDRQATCHEIYAQLVDFHSELGRPDLEIITSGTPTYPIAAAYPGFANLRHQISPGTVVYWDLTSDGLEIEGYRHAATVLSTVISNPNEKRITFDAGSKALDAAIGDPCCRVRDWDGLLPQRPSEEHLPVVVETGEAPALGSRLHLIPRHVCPTVNLADEAVLVEGGAIKAIVPVAARGHETLGKSG
ncbi:MAG: alanine racemase [Planctomycetota bacterium]|jgi:D-serine deaminase-like pyridoxal phosphate-dependent protein